jgi:hypothetical protein
MDHSNCAFTLYTDKSQYNSDDTLYTQQFFGRLEQSQFVASSTVIIHCCSNRGHGRGSSLVLRMTREKTQDGKRKAWCGKREAQDGKIEEVLLSHIKQMLHSLSGVLRELIGTPRGGRP